MNIKDKIEIIAKEYKSQSSLWNPKAVTELKDKQIDNALKSFAKGCSKNDIAVLVDTTVFQSGKNGYIFSIQGVYSKDFAIVGKEYRFIPYDEISKVSAATKKSYLNFQFNDGHQKDVSCFYCDEVQYMLNGILELLAVEKRMKNQNTASKLLDDESWRRRAAALGLVPLEVTPAKAKTERKAKKKATEKDEAEFKAKKEAVAKEEEREAKEETATKTEAEHKAKEEAATKTEAKRKAKEEVAAKAKAEAELKATEEAECRAKKEAEAAAKAEAERKSAEEAAASAKAQAERKDAEKAAARVKAEAERKAAEEAAAKSEEETEAEAKVEAYYKINNDGCGYCGLCPEMCPADAIIIEVDHFAIDPDTCFGCRLCAEACPMGCIELVSSF